MKESSNSNDPGSTALRKGLVYAAVTVFLLLMGYLAFDDAIEKRFNPNRSPESTRNGTAVSVELARNRYGHYVSSGTINDQAVVFLLDTGATNVSVPQAVAKRLELQRGRQIPVSTANGTVYVYTTTLRKISLGGIELFNIPANINPHMEGESVLLGMSFLGQLNFSQQGDRLTLQQMPGGLD